MLNRLGVDHEWV